MQVERLQLALEQLKAKNKTLNDQVCVVIFCGFLLVFRTDSFFFSLS
jgi:hypothetical protein